MIGIAEDVPAAQKHICNKQQWELPNRLTHPQSHGGSLPPVHPQPPNRVVRHTQQGQIPLPNPFRPHAHRTNFCTRFPVASET